MNSRNISDPKLFFASLQAQFDIFNKQEKSRGSQTHQFENRQSELDHELDHLIGNMPYHPDFSLPPSSSPALRKKDSNVLPETYMTPGRHSATTIHQDANHSTNSGSSYSNVMAAVFSGATVMILALSWSFWPTSHWNWPYVHPQVQQAGAAKPVASANITDTVEPVASADITNRPELVASIDVDNTVANKSDALNTILAANPAGAGHAAKPALQKSNTDNLLKIVPPIGRIRSEPGLQGDVVTRLVRGSLVVALGRQGDWLRIRLPDNREAWAYKTIVTPAINMENQHASASKKEAVPE